MSQDYKILIVEDDDQLLDLIAELFEEEGYQTEIAKNGQEALDKLRSVEEGKAWYDVVLSDINMPVVDGLKLLTLMRERGVQCSFIFLTGYASKEKALTAMRHGAYDMIDKPFEHIQLSQAVKLAAEFGRSIKNLNLDLSEKLRTGQLKQEEVQRISDVYSKLLRLKKIEQAS